MHKLLKSVLVATVALCGSAPSNAQDKDKAPIYVRKTAEGDLCIRAHEDRIVIQQIVVNRNKCQVVWDMVDARHWDSHAYLPATLAFGDRECFEIVKSDALQRPTDQFCHIIEATVIANQGSWTFKWR